jgi:hypothetical protein
MDRLKEIKKRLKATTPGQWKDDTEWLIDQLELWEKANKEQDPELKMWSARTRKNILETRKFGGELLALVDRYEHAK